MFYRRGVSQELYPQRYNRGSPEVGTAKWPPTLERSRRALDQLSKVRQREAMSSAEDAQRERLPQFRLVEWRDPIDQSLQANKTLSRCFQLLR